MEDFKLKSRVLDIAYKNKLSHLGSYFSALSIIDDTFYNMKKDDIFILSSGHAALALYAVMEKYYNIDAEYLFKTYGGHPVLSEKDKIYCSTGSLGMGITVAVGRALGNRNRNVHVLISDGECAEGSVWESLRFINDNNISNIRVHVNINGYVAYDKINKTILAKRLMAFYDEIIIHYTSVEHFPFLKELNAHYHIMSEKDYLLAKEMLNEKII